jgi:hypothetical protein
MKAERAKWLLDNRVYDSFRFAFVRGSCIGENPPTYPDGITEEEDKYIKRVWNLLPGNYAYIHAIMTISSGEDKGLIAKNDTNAELLRHSQLGDVLSIDEAGRETLVPIDDRGGKMIRKIPTTDIPPEKQFDHDYKCNDVEIIDTEGGDIERQK